MRVGWRRTRRPFRSAPTGRRRRRDAVAPTCAGCAAGGVYFGAASTVLGPDRWMRSRLNPHELFLRSTGPPSTPRPPWRILLASLWSFNFPCPVFILARVFRFAPRHEIEKNTGRPRDAFRTSNRLRVKLANLFRWRL